MKLFGSVSVSFFLYGLFTHSLGKEPPTGVLRIPCGKTV